jgi:predicted Na+-dependent transporter
MQARARLPLAGYPELAAVLIAAVTGLTARAPLAWIGSHQGLNVLLAVLVFATALTISPDALREVTRGWRSLLAALTAGATVLPLLSWAASRIVPAGSLRDGVMTIGLAPAEIASVATTAMADGETALAAGVLIGSTLTSVAAAGPVLALEAGRAGLHPARIIASLALVVALPLGCGILARSRVAWRPRAQRAATLTATGTVAALVAVIAAQVRPAPGYLAAALALAVLLGASAAAGWLLGRMSRPRVAAALLLTTSMRDFAIAAGLAAAAFGPPAAAPLGLYGLLVMAWGTAVAGRLRRRRVPLPAGTAAHPPG